MGGDMDDRIAQRAGTTEQGPGGHVTPHSMAKESVISWQLEPGRLALIHPPKTKSFLFFIIPFIVWACLYFVLRSAC